MMDVKKVGFFGSIGLIEGLSNLFKHLKCLDFVLKGAKRVLVLMKLALTPRLI